MKKIIVTFITAILISIPMSAKFFIHQGDKYVETDWAADTLSNEEIANHLGYIMNQFFWYRDFDNENSPIRETVHKLNTAEVLFVETEDNVSSITEKDVQEYLINFVYKERITPYDYAKTMEDACTDRNFSLKFMAEIMNIKYNESCKDTTLIDTNNKFKYIFQNGFMTQAIPTDGLTKWARSFEDNPYFATMKEYAKSYWKTNNDKVIWELNTQCDAWSHIPSCFKNKFCYIFAEYGTKICNAKVMNVALYGDTDITEEVLKNITHNQVTCDGNMSYFGKNCKRYSYKGFYFLFDKYGKFYKVVEQ